VTELTLWKGLATGVLSEEGTETEGFGDWEGSLDDDHWGSDDLFFFKDDTSFWCDGGVDTAGNSLWALDFDVEDWLLESWFGSELGSVEDSSGGWHNLTGTSMDGISVEGDIENVKLATSHLFFHKGTFFGSPLESGDNGIFDFVQVVNSLGGVNNDVWSDDIRTEAPDLFGVVWVPAPFFSQVVDLFFGVLEFWRDFFVFHLDDQIGLDWLGFHEDSVMLVWRFGQRGHGGFLADSFSVGDDWVGLDDWDLSVVFFQIFQADFQVKFTGTSDNLFSGVGKGDLDHRVGFGESFETFDQLWELGWILWSDGDLDDWGNGESHNFHVMGVLVGGDGTGFDEVLIDSDETDDVTGWDGFNGFDVSTHHQDGPLDVLDVEIFFLAWLEVGSHNPGFHTGGNGTSKDSSESVESTFIGSWDHLGDVHHQWGFWVASFDTDGAWIVLWSFVQEFASVGLRGDWGWQVDGDHLQESFTGWEPVSHDGLHKSFFNKTVFFVGEEVFASEPIVHDLFLHDGPFLFFCRVWWW